MSFLLTIKMWETILLNPVSTDLHGKSNFMANTSLSSVTDLYPIEFWVWQTSVLHLSNKQHTRSAFEKHALKSVQDCHKI